MAFFCTCWLGALGVAETHEVSRREFSLVYRAGEGIFFGNGFHRVCLSLLTVSTVFCFVLLAVSTVLV